MLLLLLSQTIIFFNQHCHMLINRSFSYIVFFPSRQQWVYGACVVKQKKPGTEQCNSFVRISYRYDPATHS